MLQCPYLIQLLKEQFLVDPVNEVVRRGTKALSVGSPSPLLPSSEIRFGNAKQFSCEVLLEVIGINHSIFRTLLSLLHVTEGSILS